MTNITLALPRTVAERMKKHPEIRWSRIAREAIIQRIELLEVLEKATEPRLNEEKAIKLALEIHHSYRGKRDWKKFLRV